MTAKSLQLTAIIGFALLGLGGCGAAQAVRDATSTPALSPIADPTFDATGRRQVVIPAMAPPREGSASNSLWRQDARQFFSDPRAANVGDILTVDININDQASFSDTSSRQRTATHDGGVSSFFGLEQIPGRVLPQGYDPANMVSTNSTGAFNGTGAIARNESVNLTVAAIVTQVLPNGNLVVAGRQEVRVNNEVRELLVSGIVRPQDITNANTILHTQMAEARISYGGRGQISAYQRPPAGQAVLEAISPF